MDDRFMLIDASNKIICEGQVKEFYRGEAVFKVENGLDAQRIGEALLDAPGR